MRDNLALSSFLSELPDVVVAVSSYYNCKFVFSHGCDWVDILNAELSKTELWHEVARKKRLEEAEHWFWVICEPILSVCSILSYDLGLINPCHRNIASFSSRCEMEILVHTKDVNSPFLRRAREPSWDKVKCDSINNCLIRASSKLLKLLAIVSLENTHHLAFFRSCCHKGTIIIQSNSSDPALVSRDLQSLISLVKVNDFNLSSNLSKPCIHSHILRSIHSTDT